MKVSAAVLLVLALSGCAGEGGDDADPAPAVTITAEPDALPVSEACERWRQVKVGDDPARMTIAGDEYATLAAQVEPQSLEQRVFVMLAGAVYAEAVAVAEGGEHLAPARTATRDAMAVAVRLCRRTA